MPSPLLHGAAGAAVLAFDRRLWELRRRRAMALVLAAALLPDLDLLLGVVLSDPNRFHSGLTHTLGFSLLVGAVFGLAAGGERLRAGILSFAACWIHAGLDSLTADQRAPIGVPLFWPVTDFRVCLRLLPGVRHGLNGASMQEFFRELFSLANLRTLGLEAIIGGLLFAAAWLIGRARRRGRAATHARGVSARAARMVPRGKEHGPA